MTTIIRHGLGDNPLGVSAVWLASCAENHPEVIYIGGVQTVQGAAGRHGLHISGQCPACAGALAARWEDQIRRGEAP